MATKVSQKTLLVSLIAMFFMFVLFCAAQDADIVQANNGQITSQQPHAEVISSTPTAAIHQISWPLFLKIVSVVMMLATFAIMLSPAREQSWGFITAVILIMVSGLLAFYANGDLHNLYHLITRAI